MPLYSFCIRKKGNQGYFRGNAKHELAFLDYFATRFNNKEELLTFLGVDPKIYDDIKIGYQSNYELKLLPIYFDARELEYMVNQMINFKSLDEFTDTLKITIAYQNKESFDVKRTVPRNYATTDIMSRLFYSDRPYSAFNDRLLHQKAVIYWENNDRLRLEREMLSSYLNIRKSYEFLRENEYILPNKKYKIVPKVTMQEIANDLIYQRFNNNDDLTDYQLNLLKRVNENDEKAYEELMGNSIEEVETLVPYVKRMI